MGQTAEALAEPSGEALSAIRGALVDGLLGLTSATESLLESGPARAAAVASPYLRLFGTVAGGWLLAHSALAARRRLEANDGGDRAFLEAKIKTARFYADNLLPQAAGLARSVVRGADSTLALDEAQF
jgi:hypothetical protein